ncbi:MAG: glycosyl transferase family 1, partial [Bacteroidetes bacterium]|nr:glycosyl transferase family 1 [Bacteroidota bacterium]
MKPTKKILFLYTELAVYFLCCIKALAKEEGNEIHIVHWPLNPEAPFEFDFPKQVKFYPKKEYSRINLLKLAAQINPDLIYCSGWVDKDYLKICRKFRNKIPVVVGFDNQWTGSTKQWLAVAARSFTIAPYFSHAWVPGESQAEFALNLGFGPQRILKGFYSADFDYFHSLYLKNKESKQTHFPKCFIYVGRYIE